MHLSILSVVGILVVLPDLALAQPGWKAIEVCDYGLMFGKGVKKAVRCTPSAQRTYLCGDTGGTLGK